MTHCEKMRIKALIYTMLGYGFTLHAVDDGEEAERIDSVNEAIAAIESMDESILVFKDNNGGRYKIEIILGNDPSGTEVIANWYATRNASSAVDFDLLMDRLT